MDTEVRAFPCSPGPPSEPPPVPKLRVGITPGAPSAFLDLGCVGTARGPSLLVQLRAVREQTASPHHPAQPLLCHCN